MTKCTICLTRKGKRKCLIMNTFICSLCCGQTRKGETCSSCSYFQNHMHYAESGRKILLERVEKSEFFGGKTTFVDSKNEGKMSEIIMDFAKPILDVSNDVEGTEKAIGVAIIVWNAFVLPEGERRQIIKQLISEFSLYHNKEYLAVAKYVIEILMKRRKKYFSHNKRIIIDYQFSEEGKDFRLNVVSTPSSTSLN